MTDACPCMPAAVTLTCRATRRNARRPPTLTARVVNPSPDPLPHVLVCLTVGPALFELVGLGDAAAPDIPGRWERRFELPPDRVREVLRAAQGRRPAEVGVWVYAAGEPIADVFGREVTDALAELARSEGRVGGPR